MRLTKTGWGKAACAAVALIVPVSVRAQEQTPPPPAPPAAPATPAPAAAPQAPAAQAPATNAAPQQGAAPAAGENKLPEVEVIQDQPKPPEEKPASEQKAETKKPAPKPVAEAPAPKPKAKPVAQAAPAEAVAPVETATPAPPLSTEIKMSPVGGSEIPIAKVPGSVAHVSNEEIKRTGAIEAQNILQTNVPGVIVTDLQGNGFQTDVQYRGFSSSPVNGVPQGLAVYQNGVRINESFGDVVNWDFLPSVAINDITVVAGNPVFGLNAVGGAISIGMKDGFNFRGTEIDGRFGSNGRYQGSFQTGQRSGAFAAYLALEGAHDDGWRENSPSDIKRMYADLGVKTKDAEFHVNFTGAQNFVGAVTAAPVELLAKDYARTYTWPQTTDNSMTMASLNGTVSVTDTLKISGVAYRRKFDQKHVDANVLDAQDCGGVLCVDGENFIGMGRGVNANGTIPFGLAQEFASIDHTSQDAGSEGVTLQAVETSKLFGLGNHLIVGASYDHGEVHYGASSELAQLEPRFYVTSLGIAIVDPNDISPRSINTTNDYYGLYFSDTLDLTKQLSVTVGGRYNIADLSIKDLTGRDPFLNASSHYERFNPQAGATYTFVPGLTLYGSYSEANRAPTPAELACADPNNPCLLESFLTADPPLKQVVSHTSEIGLRGETSWWATHEKIEWGVALFHTLNTDDIISVAAPQSGRGFFQNAGDTLREGVEANISYRNKTTFLYANYNYTDATFQTPLVLASPHNPLATTCPGTNPADDINCVNVEKGNTMPGIPKHKFKAGFDYFITPQWKFGADVVAASSQVFFGDEGNQNQRLGGYATVNLHTSYDINEHVQIYGLANNVLDTRYGTFGNYFNREQGSAASLGEFNFTDARTVVPGAPFAAYGGMRVKF